ncbi:MAG TPA: hypothetical protein GXX38_05895 [Clostridia bacterium]|jgi:hypothetical protein|nr:hypothetical protein [Clostridia bacterium]
MDIIAERNKESDLRENKLELWVLAAAVAAYLDSSLDQIKIISVQRVSEVWKRPNLVLDWKDFGHQGRIDL